MVHILVFDDHLAVREGTKSILETEENFKVTCFNPPFSQISIEQYDFSTIDIVLMDLNLGDDSNNGISLSKEILKVVPEMKIIIYTGYNVKDYWDEAIQSGIYGVLNKSDNKEKIIDYIHHALEGNIVVNFHQYQKFLISAEEDSTVANAKSSKDTINDREKIILREVEKGLTNQEIADKLHLSKRSIEYSLTNIYGKLNIGTRTEAVLIAKSEGLID